MKSLEGVSASPGFAIGKALLYIDDTQTIPQYAIGPDQVVGETARFGAAIAKSIAEIEGLSKSQGKRREEQLMLNTHLLMLQDPDFRQRVNTELAKSLFNVEWVLSKIMKDMIAKLSKVKDEYLRERTSDFNDVSRRVLTNLLSHARTPLGNLTEDVILICRDLMPSDAIGMDKTHIKALAMDGGGKTSHTAILARAFEIPAVLGLADITAHVKNGDELIIDGHRGRVIINPDQKTQARYAKLADQLKNREAQLQVLRDLPAETLDGRRVSLEANIEIPEEFAGAFSHGAEGIGLFRSEFLFLRSEVMPNEDEQYEAYAKVLRAMPDQPVTIRTLDIGGDKILKNMNLQLINEKNPILGWRAIRFCLAHPAVFRTQLRAILRASVHGRLRLMFPLISGTDELDQVLAILNEVRAELRAEKIPVAAAIPIGIMIEVPSAAMVADLLAQKADFFSIGTNDLIQYTVAVDRGNEHTAYLYNPLHLGVLRLIKQVIAAGHAAGLPVSMCGEMASDPLHTLILLGLGLDGFSMSAASIPEVKRIVRETTYREAQDFVEQILQCTSSSAIAEFVQRTMEEKFEVTYY